MKLLFDQNLSFKLCQQLSDQFPGSTQVRLVGLHQADDRTIWEYAKVNGFALVSLDSDFARDGGVRRTAAKGSLAALRQSADERKETARAIGGNCRFRTDLDGVPGDLLGQLETIHLARTG